MEKQEIAYRLDVACPIKPKEVDSEKLIWNKEKRKYEKIKCKSNSITLTQLRGRKALIELLFNYINNGERRLKRR